MCESKNFVISLNLSNFFVDHRAMCKIFINKKMKCVKDLENHISTIFEISNFYFISRGHYIPSTEDIRILQPNDMLFAIPNQWTSIGSIITSTPTSDVGKKSRKKDTSSSIDNPHKSKKRKTSDFDLEQQNKEIVTNTILKPKKKRKKNKNVEEVLSNIDSSGFQENQLDTPVKEKVSYFEKQIKKPTHNTDNNDCQKNISKDLSNDTPIHTTTVSDSETQNNAPNFKQKKFFFQKRNNDLISHDLPKKSNIIKSILLSNKPSTSDQAILPITTSNSKANFQNSNENLNYKILQMNNRENSLECNDNNDIEMSGVSSIKESRSFDNNVKCNIVESNSTENVDTITNIENIDFTEEHSSHVHIEKENTINTEKPTGVQDENVTSIENNMANQHAQKFYVNEAEAGDVIQLKSPTSSTPSFTSLNLKSTDIETCCKVENMSPESDFSQCDTTSNSSILPDENNHFVNAEFITKRKRKRSRKKHKTKVNTSENAVITSNQKSEYIFRPPAATVSHIKFNDEGDPIDNVTQIDKEDSLPDVSKQTVNITNVPIPLSFLENTKEENKSNSCSNNDSTVIVSRETFDKKNEVIYNANNCISEDTILRSPLMSAIKPKHGDIIAFQMLRLSNDYTPQISKYITGKVLAVTKNNTEIEMKIIDGIDECKEPEGKFSIESENDNATNIRTFNWNALFAPRLIFP